MAESRTLPSADLDDNVRTGDGPSIRHLAQVRDGAEIDENMTVEQGAYIGSGVYVGDSCRIQSYALAYELAHLEDGVFVGPATVLANGTFSRVISPNGISRSAHDREPVGMILKRGSPMGAHAMCVAPTTIGKRATVAAGPVVTRDVPVYVLVAGVPAQRIKWVGRSDFPLEETGLNTFHDPHTGNEFEQVGRTLNLVKET